MQRLGKVLNVTPSQNIIIKSDKSTKMGTDVVDEDLKVVGTTFDLIGPISSPYIIIRPKIKHPERLVGKKLYTFLSRKNRRKK